MREEPKPGQAGQPYGEESHRNSVPDEIEQVGDEDPYGQNVVADEALEGDEPALGPLQQWMQRQSGTVDYIHSLYPDQMDQEEAQTVQADDEEDGQ
ncbi:hypothetical protein MJA45_03410 [Paenibacillus aurantius]|uniref:Uncharacterized protein n=1 Tax=Paenibacillus aurantius TaxID=2918900 RepID=A0AA96LII5_9BACL|nr:hypothetical protein [Paenibacillus aurantius]WNQ12122.1 hypothetical protein MJA45_03410 [Paenibacillus aurantius]